MAKAKQKEKFRISHIPSLIIEAGKAWLADDPWRLSAIVAYYALLSLPGLLLVIINAVGFIWGHDIVQGRLTGEIASVIGPDSADAVKSIIANAGNEGKSTVATLVGVATLIFGATGVFYHLQLSLNEIWGIRQNPKSNFLQMITDRAVSFGFVLIVGFLLLVSFVVTAGLATLGDYLAQILPDFSIHLAHLLNLVLSIGIISVLFALIFRLLPDAIIGWRSVWLGALITAILFTVGKELLGLYFGQANPGSTYGAAGSLILILLWVSYSCLILFFGAEFTWVFARRYGHGVRPQKHAVFVKVEKVVVEKENQSID